MLDNVIKIEFGVASVIPTIEKMRHCMENQEWTKQWLQNLEDDNLEACDAMFAARRDSDG